MKRTLSGFDCTPKSAEGWQRYISELEARRQAVVTDFHEIEAPTKRHLIKAASRYDLLSELILRAQDELKFAMGN